MNNYEWLIANLDAFIRKYYANKVIRGIIVFLSSTLLAYLTLSISEYFLYLPVTVKISCIVLFLLINLVSLIYWIVIPLAQMAQFGKVINHEQAAKIIGQHFNEVSDKLLNILQLKQMSAQNVSQELVAASIEQKIAQISVIPFLSAIDLTKNKKHLKYLLPLLAIGMAILILSPNIFQESNARLLQPTKQFERPMPFSFVIHNPTLEVVRNHDFTLEIAVEGKVLPSAVYVAIGNDQLLMQQNAQKHYTYTFKNITTNTHFKLYGAGYYSSEYEIKVLQKPILKAFKVQLNYPAYTGKKPEIRQSLSDMIVPVGTMVNWAFFTEYADEATVTMGNGNPQNLFKTAGMFGMHYKFLADTSYQLKFYNKTAHTSDSFQYNVQVIPDQYPVLQIQQQKDTNTNKQVAITGNAGDDYGISRVAFQYEISANNAVVEKKSIPIKANPGALTTFEYYFDIEKLALQQGQKVSYYVEAWDNDGVHGAKSTRSEVSSFQMLDEKGIDSAINANANQISSGISNSAQSTHELQDEYKSMQSKMMQSDKMDWQQQEALQAMMKKQEALKQQLEKVQQKFDEQRQQTDQKKFSDNVKNKQDELKKQLDNLLNAELKEQMKRLQELMQKLNKETAVDAMKKMEQDNKLMRMDMERMESLMSKLEQEMRMEDMANKMDQLAQKQAQLEKKTETNKGDLNKVLAEQEQLKKELEKVLKEDMKELQDVAKKNKQDKDLDKAKDNGDDAKKNMEASEKDLKEKDKDKASKEQKQAEKNLKSMADALRKGANGMKPETIKADIRAVRQLLSNLIRLSFDQEDLMQKVKTTPTSSQQYIVNQEEQNRLHKNALMIRDSLFALSKKSEKLPAIINKNTTDMERNLQLALDAIEERNVNAAITKQQYVMTQANNLALVLNEMLSNLMQMDADGGEGSCAMPGGKKPKPGPGQQLSDIITEQEQLGDMMQQMARKQGNKPGNKPGEGKKEGEGDKDGKGTKDGDGKSEGKGQKPGSKGENGSGMGGSGTGGEGENNSEAEQIARLAEQQAGIRRKIQELATLLNSKGLSGEAKQLRELEGKMDKNETDLVNRRLSNEIMLRQRDILTRLLETEKAVRNQEEDEKRSSQSAKELSRPIPPMLQKYFTDQKSLLELYKTAPPQLKPYYRKMVENYFLYVGGK